jgi:hypothetical protein
VRTKRHSHPATTSKVFQVREETGVIQSPSQSSSFRLQLRPQYGAISHVANTFVNRVRSSRPSAARDRSATSHACDSANLFRRRRDDDLRDILESRNAVQTVTNHFRLGDELCFVSKLLEVAATAATEVRTRRLDSRLATARESPGWKQRERSPVHVRFEHADAISGRSKRHEDSLSLSAWANPMPPGRIRSISTSNTTRSFSHKKAQKAQTNLVKKVQSCLRLHASKLKLEL